MKDKVYFSNEITKESLVRIYQSLGVKLTGNVAVKVHTGEAGNQNFLRPSLMEDIIDEVNGTVVECNTAYEGTRSDTKRHLHLLENHGWNIFKTDILDGTDEVTLEIPNGKIIDKNYVGKNLLNYDSMLVISHFKGHPMGGFGGALKNISIGLASSHGKAYIHGAGHEEDIWTAKRDLFIEAMADACKSITDYFKENIVYINIMANMSVDCDCCSVALDPQIADIGILASLNPVALDQACLDLVYNSADAGKKHLIERIESRNGAHIIDAATALNVGSKDYELVKIN